MISYILIFINLFVSTFCSLPTLYEYYTGEGISSGLSTDQQYFTLNGKNITILSGTIHYFRVPSQYWRDRLRKLRAAGLNTVETYIPWNLHEPYRGTFDFGSGGSDFEQFLDVRSYIQMAQEEDLFVILRPGPYICAEWEWGGLPSWLLREEGIMVRTADPVYLQYVARYFSQLFSLIEDLQFTRGGPIIALQVENEYGGAPEKDLDYMRHLHEMFKEFGIRELLVTSDNVKSGQNGALPDLLLQTVNFGSNPVHSFDSLKEMQPGKPLMGMEFWTGWFDSWSNKHHTVSNSTFHKNYEGILTYPASANMYMFHGGTNWGFLNGASISSGDNSGFQPTTTSYDYDAPLSEAGDYTGKYEIVKELIEKYRTIEIFTPERPELIPRVAYPSIAIDGILNVNDIIERSEKIMSEVAIPMEKLPINNNSGQSYGYVIYRKEHLNIPANSVLTITAHLRDTVVVLINGVSISSTLSSSDDLDGFGFYRLQNSSIILSTTDLEDATLDLVVENWGRGNGGRFYRQFKGLTQDNHVFINEEELSSWTIFPLEFKKSWNVQLSGWKSVENNNDLTNGPGLYRAVLTLEEDPVDTFIDMQDWSKGIVIVNGFVLGRYALIGPQQTLYLPGPFLQKGDNEIVVYEHFRPATEIKFSREAIFYTR